MVDNEIPTQILSAIEILKNCFDGISVELLSESLKEKKQTGQIGVDIKIKSKPVFLVFEKAEDIVNEPYGKQLAEAFIVNSQK